MTPIICARMHSKRSVSLVVAVVVALLAVMCLMTTGQQVLTAHPAFAATDTYPSQWANAPQDSMFDTWKEYNRECTSYVAWMLHSVNGFEMPFNDNAVNWGPDAAAKGYKVDMNPATGSVFWTSSPQHVAWVEAVSTDGKNVTIEDYNSDNTGHWGEHTVATSSASGYIHFKDISSGGGAGTGSTADGSRIAQPSGAQSIFQRGAALPVDYSDAVRYNNEGNASVQTNYTAALPAANLPPNTVLRPVGSNSQYLWSSNGQLLPIGDPATSACYLFAFPQGNGTPAVVPADWEATLPIGPPGQCSLGDGTRFTETDTGLQQYVSVRGAALTLTYGDALAYNGEQDTAVISMPAGYIQNPIHAAVLPMNTVLRAASSAAQYFWDGTQLHAIADVATSQCLLFAFAQNGVALVPPSWTSGRSQGPAEQCSLPDGTRFNQTDQGAQQFISVRGAALPVDYADAVKYNGEGDRNVFVMQAGYTQNSIHAPRLPVTTVLRPVGSNSQYFWDGTKLHYVPNASTSQCLLKKYPQNGVAIVPADWEASLSVGANQACT